MSSYQPRYRAYNPRYRIPVVNGRPYGRIGKVSGRGSYYLRNRGPASYGPYAPVYPRSSGSVAMPDVDAGTRFNSPSGPGRSIDPYNPEDYSFPSPPSPFIDRAFNLGRRRIESITESARRSLNDVFNSPGFQEGAADFLKGIYDAGSEYLRNRSMPAIMPAPPVYPNHPSIVEIPNTPPPVPMLMPPPIRRSGSARRRSRRSNKRNRNPPRRLRF